MKVFSRFVLIAIALSMVAGQALGQQYPTRPIRWLIPFAAGGPTDLLARAIAPRLSDALGVAVVVENKVGAGGGIAMAAAAKAAPDGYTIVMGHTGTLAINPHVYSDLQYDPLKDFAPITPVVKYANILLIDPKAPISNVKALVAYAKVNPGKVNIGVGGKGVVSDIYLSMLKSLTGAPIENIYYKGDGPSLVAALTGEVIGTFQVLNTGLPQIKAGKLRPLAVTSAERSSYAPGVPTMREAGVDGFDEALGSPWFGILAPAGTPKAIVDRLYEEISKALNSPEVAERIRAQSFDRWTLPPNEFATRIRSDYEKWGAAIRAAGVKPE